MRRLLVLLACLAVAACGADESTDEAARHLDPRSDAVIAVDLDYDGGNWKQVKTLYARAVAAGLWDAGESFAPPTLDGLLNATAGYGGLSFTDDIEPLLGGTLHVGVAVEPAEPLPAEVRDILEQVDFDRTRFTRDGRAVYRGFDGEPVQGITSAEVERAQQEAAQREPQVRLTASYRVQDADALDRVVGKLRGQGLEPQPIGEDAQRLAEGIAIVGGDTLVAAFDERGEDADGLLRERLAAGDAPALPELRDDLVAARAAPGLLGAWLDRDELGRALATPAGTALRGAQAALRLEEDAARGSARVDFEGLPDAELPLPPPGDDLAIPAGEALASASADQSYTTVFLARLARELWPDSRFVQRVAAYERQAAVRFEDEVLRQFAGPSFSILRPGDPPQFAARSTLADPAAMRARLDSLAPALPGILEGLEGLGSTGLTSLLFVAPDAPLTPSAFALLAQVGVDRVEGGADEQLYAVSGLRDVQANLDRVVYGLIGDAFVVASSEQLAREVAALPAEPAAPAGTRLRVDAARLLERWGGWVSPGDIRIARALLEGAEASASAEDGDVVGEAEVRWKR